MTDPVKYFYRTTMISIYEKYIEGFITENDIVYYLMPLSRFTGNIKDSEKVIICKSDDLIKKLFHENDVVKINMTETLLLKSLDYNNPVRILSIAVEGDYEYYQNHSANPSGFIENLINQAEGVYQSTFNILFRIVYNNVYTISGDPFTEEFTYANQDNVIDELETHFTTSHSNIYSDVVFLFTGKEIEDIYGIADDQPGSYGVVGDFTDNYLTFAHELGHTLNGDHGYALDCGTPNASVMCQGGKKVPLYFSASNISRINSHISTRLISYSYFDEELLCDSESFSVFNIPSGATISWSKSNNLSFYGSSTGSPVTIYPTSNGTSWVEPTITIGSTSVSFPRDEFWAGEPHDLELYCEGRGDLFTYAFYVTPFYDGDSIVWGVYPTPAELTDLGYGYATIRFDEPGIYDIWAYVENECGPGTPAYIYGFYVYDYLMSPNPASTEVEITISAGPEEGMKSASLSSDDEYTVTILDNYGVVKIQKKYFGKKFTLPVSSLKDGNYFVKINNGKMNATKQLIIKR